MASAARRRKKGHLMELDLSYRPSRLLPRRRTASPTPDVALVEKPFVRLISPSISIVNRVVRQWFAMVAARLIAFFVRTYDSLGLELGVIFCSKIDVVWFNCHISHKILLAAQTQTQKTPSTDVNSNIITATHSGTVSHYESLNVHILCLTKVGQYKPKESKTLYLPEPSSARISTVPEIL